MKITDVIPSVRLPAGKVGKYTIDQFEVNEMDAVTFNLKQHLHDTPEMGMIPGTYTRLWRQDETPVVMMSDTLSERRDHVDFVLSAWGDVLINGLGLGMCIDPLMEQEEVCRVTVVEKQQEIIDLVAPTYCRRYPKRFRIVHADAFLYEPEECPDVVWNDIWDNISDLNVPEMDTLEAKYKEAAWVDSWARERCENFVDFVKARIEKWDRIAKNLRLLQENGRFVDSSD